MMQQEFDRFVNQNKRLSLDLCKRKFDELVESRIILDISPPPLFVFCCKFSTCLIMYALPSSESDKQLFYKNDSTHIADIDTYFYAIQNFPPEFEVWRKTYTVRLLMTLHKSFCLFILSRKQYVVHTKCLFLRKELKTRYFPNLLIGEMLL